MISLADIRDKLPPEATASDNGELEYNGERVAFFIPNVLCLVEVVVDDLVETSVRVVFLFPDGSESKTFTLRPDELDKVTIWQTLDRRCLLDSVVTKY